MESKEKKHSHTGKYWIAGIFIAIGLLLLGRNLGYIQPEAYSLIVSWKSLLIVLGVFMLAKRHYFNSFILIAIGAYFILTTTGDAHTGIVAFYWPVILIIIGIGFLVRKNHRSNHHNQYNMEVKESVSGDGYFSIDNRFGGIQNIIMDEVIKGGEVKNSFGGVVLDLRRTSLPEGITYIDVDVRFGGLEIYIPSTWKVKSEVRPFIGAYEDNRFTNPAMDSDRMLVIRGEISVGGIEVKG